MNNQEAIRLLKTYRNCLFGILAEPIDMAIKALEQESSGDVISRQYLLDNCVVDKVTMPYVPIRRIQEAPSVTSQPKIGLWIRWYEQKENDGYTEYIPHCKCSECGKEYDPYSSQFIKYCNECGAKMQDDDK